MKLIKQITWSILFASCFVVFMACSDDNKDAEEVITNPSIVFTGGQPKSVLGMSMTYTDGLLTKIGDDGKNITFSYGLKTRSSIITKADSTNLKMTVEYDDDPNDVRYFDLIIGSNGFVEKCIETYKDNADVDTWEFGYNADGQLNYMKRSEGGNEVTTITYENGNITAVSMVSEDDGDKLNTRIYYTSDAIKTAIENKGCLMLFDITFGVDMDEMKYAYWAGLLGKATKHLPIKLISVENSLEEDTETFEWNLSNGYPNKMIETASWGSEEYSFTW